MIDIEEMIADARAEEEVKKEMEKVEEEKTRYYSNFDNFQVENQLIKITLAEYLNYKNLESDYTRLINTIKDSLELYYGHGDRLGLKNCGDRIIETMTSLYPDFMKEQIERLNAEDEEE